jgi:hypothetical protein
MKLKWTDHVAHIGAKGSDYWVLAGGSEGKRPLRRPRIYGRAIDLKEIG